MGIGVGAWHRRPVCWAGGVALGGRDEPSRSEIEIHLSEIEIQLIAIHLEIARVCRR
jgi:hypothetical protein